MYFYRFFLSFLSGANRYLNESKTSYSFLQIFSITIPIRFQNVPKTIPGLGGSDEANKRVRLSLKTFLCLIVFWFDTCFVELTKFGRVRRIGKV